VPSGRLPPSFAPVPQVVATLPFQATSCLCLTLIIYGMAGLRPEPVAVAQSCTISMLMSLIAVQVRRRAGGGGRDGVGRV
jgi:hypothetical protein